MSASSVLSVGSFSIYSLDDQVHSDLLDLFRREELVKATGVNEEGDAEHIVRYEAPAYVIRDRLDVMGFDIESTRRVFRDGLEAVVASLRETADDDKALDVVRESARHAIEELESASFEQWREAFIEIAHRGERTPTSRLARFILDDDLHTCLGFPPHDELHYLRAALDVFADEVDTALVTYDLSDIVNEYTHEPDDFVPYSLESDTLPAVAPNKKLIVLTEGKSDRAVLELALQVVYPHLSEFWSFLDFDGVKQPGGASQVVALLKALAAAGITNRVVALLDNDTAATEALRALDVSRLPRNFRVVRLPESNLAVTYPTIGPSGTIETLNVNGLAVSIELFFGPDVLVGDGGQFTPIQWRGYNATLGQYQGEILDKARLLDSFLRKAKQCVEDRSLICASDWQDMTNILATIKNAFSGG